MQDDLDDLMRAAMVQFTFWTGWLCYVMFSGLLLAFVGWTYFNDMPTLLAVLVRLVFLGGWVAVSLIAGAHSLIEDDMTRP